MYSNYISRHVPFKLCEDISDHRSVIDGLLDLSASLVESKPIVTFLKTHALDQCMYNLNKQKQIPKIKLIIKELMKSF